MVVITSNFTATPVAGEAPLSVQFTDTSLGSPVARARDFGDGSIATTQSPAHVYSRAGSFNVTLVVTDGAGLTDTETKVAFVGITVPNIYSVPSEYRNNMSVNEQRTFNYYFLGGPQNKDINYIDGVDSNIAIALIDTTVIGTGFDAKLDPDVDYKQIKTYRLITMTQNPVLGIVTWVVGSEINGGIRNFKQFADVMREDMIKLTYHRVKSVTSFNI